MEHTKIGLGETTPSTRHVARLPFSPGRQYADGAFGGAGVLLHQGTTPDGIGPWRFLRAADLLHELRRSPSHRTRAGGLARSKSRTKLLLDQATRDCGELDRAIEILDTQDVGCHRYSGTDPTILKRCPPEYWDHRRFEMALSSRYTFCAFRNPCEVFAFCFGSQGRASHKTMAQSRAIRTFKVTSTASFSCHV